MEQKKDHKIYKYTNKVNGKVYIGRTCTTLRRRAGYQGKGYKNCTYFWKAIQKYGWENFIGEIIEENLTDEEATEKETYYIKKFGSVYRAKGYNAIEKSQNIPEKTRVRISERREVSEETRRKISQNHADVSGKNNPMWGRHRTEEEKKKIREASIGRRLSQETCRKMSEAQTGRIPWNKGKSVTCRRKGITNKAYSKSVTCLETNITYKSLEEAGSKTGLNPNYISLVCRGKKENVEGYHWKWAQDPSTFVNGRKVKCLETDTIYNSIKEAAECTGLKRSAISEAIRRKGRSGGYSWVYADEN